MNPPITYPMAHGFRGFVADPGREVDEKLTIAILRSPWSESIAEKIKLYLWIISPAIIVFTIYDPRFIWVQLKTTLIETPMQSLK
jgi:hypothetical protein